MELFLLVSMVLTIVTFSLIVLSEPAGPSLAEHDSDFSSDFAPEESMAEMRVATVTTSTETNIPQPAF